MWSITVCSLLVALTQPPKPPDPVVQQATAWLAHLRAQPAEPDDLATILAHHPDVQIAEAELRLAQAKLAKAKQVVAQGIAAARAKLDGAKAAAAAAEQDAKRVRALGRADANGVTQQEAERAETAVAVAKAAVAVAEADLRAATGGVGQGGLVTPADAIRMHVRPADAAAPLTVGPTADKLRALMGKTVKLGATAATPADYLRTLFAAAGSDLLVQCRRFEVGGEKGPFPAGEKTLSAWLEQFQDMLNGGLQPPSHMQFYLREYGLLLCAPKDAPPGAVPLADFLRQPQG